MERNTRFKKKYLKYKSKYLNIKKLIGGSNTFLLPAPLTPPRVADYHSPPFTVSRFPPEPPVISNYHSPPFTVSRFSPHPPVISDSPSPPFTVSRFPPNLPHSAPNRAYIYQVSPGTAMSSPETPMPSPKRTPFKESQTISKCNSEINLLECLKYYTNEVISKIKRTENELNAFIADVIHDMETSGRKQKIINGSFDSYVSSSRPGIYNSKSYFDKLLIGDSRELLRAHNKAFFDPSKPKKKNDDETYREDHENNLSFAKKEYNTLTPEELNSTYSSGDIKNNIEHIPASASLNKTSRAIMKNVSYNKIIERFSDSKLDVEAENSDFSIPKLFTDPSIIDIGLYLKCEPFLRTPPRDIEKHIVMIDQGSHSQTLNKENFKAIDGRDFILDGLKPFSINDIKKNLSTNPVINQIISPIIQENQEENEDENEDENQEENQIKELFEHITDSYFKHIFDILNLKNRLDLKYSQIKIINGRWFLNFWLGKKNYLIDITNRGITRHTYNLSSLVISEYKNNMIPLEWKYLKDIDDYSIPYDNLVLFCNIVCLTAKAFGDASYKIFTYLITIYEKYHIKLNAIPTIVTQDRQLLYDLVKTSIIHLDDDVLLLPNIYYKLKSKKKKEGLIIATNTSRLPEDDFEYVKISLDNIKNISDQLVSSDSVNNYIVLLILKLCFINEKNIINLIENYIRNTENLNFFENIPIVYILSKVQEFDYTETSFLLHELNIKYDFFMHIINFRYIFNKNDFNFDNFLKNIKILFNKFKEEGKFLFKIKDILDLTPTYNSFETIYNRSFNPIESKTDLLFFIYEQSVHKFDNIQLISDLIGNKRINYLDAYLNILQRIELVHDEIPNIVDYFLENIYLAQIKFDKEKELYDHLKETNIYVWRVFLINLILFDNSVWGNRSSTSKIETLYNILYIFITSYNRTIGEQYTDSEINLLNINLVENGEDIYIDDGLGIKMHAELYYSNIHRNINLVGVSNRPTPGVSVNAGKLINKILISKEPLIKGFIRILSNIELPTEREVTNESRSEATIPTVNSGDDGRVYNCLIEKYINIEDINLLKFKLKFMPSIIYTKIMDMKEKINSLKKDLFHERVPPHPPLLILPNEAWFKARYQEENDDELSINDIVYLIIKWIVLFSPDHNKGVINENEFISCYSLVPRK